jgi:hypothetical protein
MQIDIRLKLRQLKEAAEGPGLISGSVVANICREALKEIERLESRHVTLESRLETARQWLGFIAKGENFTTVVSEEITLASAESLRSMAISTLRRLGA